MPKKSISAIKKEDVLPLEYTKFITSLKAKIRSAQIKAAVTANSELIKLYWEIGKDIFEKSVSQFQKNQGLILLPFSTEKEFVRIYV